MTGVPMEIKNENAKSFDALLRICKFIFFIPVVSAKYEQNLTDWLLIFKKPPEIRRFYNGLSFFGVVILRTAQSLLGAQRDRLLR